MMRESEENYRRARLIHAFDWKPVIVAAVVYNAAYRNSGLECSLTAGDAAWPMMGFARGGHAASSAVKFASQEIA